MPRYIDADKLYKDEIARCHCVPLVGSCTNDNKSLRDVLENAPTEDAVPRSEVDGLQAKITELNEKNAGLALACLFDCKPNDDCLSDNEWNAIKTSVEELKTENKSLAKTVNEASELIRKLRSENNRLKAYDEERDIELHQRLVREAKQEVAEQICELIKQFFEEHYYLEKPEKVTIENLHIEFLKKYSFECCEVERFIAELGKKYIGE